MDIEAGVRPGQVRNDAPMVRSTGLIRQRPHAGTPVRLVLALSALASLVAAAPMGPSSLGLAARASDPIETAVVRPATAPAAPAAVASVADWPVYHLNSGRTGDYPSFPTFAGSLAAGWSTALDGAVYAEPLVVNGMVIAATESDSVYALDPASGGILWRAKSGYAGPALRAAMRRHRSARHHGHARV